MNDTTFVGTIVARQREADLVRQNELMRAHRERGQAPARPVGRPLFAWFRGILHHGGGAAAIAGH